VCSARQRSDGAPLTLVLLATLHTQKPGGGGGHHDSVTYEGVTLHKAAGWHRALGTGLAGVMW